jgi:hypothetical protein
MKFAPMESSPDDTCLCGDSSPQNGCTPEPLAAGARCSCADRVGLHAQLDAILRKSVQDGERSLLPPPDDLAWAAGVGFTI